MVPITGAYIRRVFPKEKLGLAWGICSIPTLVVTSFGPSMGGVIIDNYAWQLIFSINSINIPVGVAGLGVAFIVLPEHRAATNWGFDLAGFASIALALGAFLLGLADGNAGWNADGWKAPFILGCFGASGAGFLVFSVVELRSEHPLVDLALFKNYNYDLGSFVLYVFGLGYSGPIFSSPSISSPDSDTPPPRREPSSFPTV